MSHLTGGFVGGEGYSFGCNSGCLNLMCDLLDNSSALGGCGPVC